MPLNKRILVVFWYLRRKRNRHRQQRRQKCWVHDINQSRDGEGEINTLYPRLRKDESKFMDYFRMNFAQFDYLFSILERRIEKQDTNFRKAYPAKWRLALTLR